MTLYRHYIRQFSGLTIKRELLVKLRQLGSYRGRNTNSQINEIPLDAMNHRINTLEYYMFGYKEKVDGVNRFLFSPLGNLLLKHLDDPKKVKKIFLTMLWAIQFPHPYGGTDRSFEVYPYRLIFKLLRDNRLENYLQAFEVEYVLFFIKKVDKLVYEDIINSILKLRKLNNEEITKLFKRNNELQHAYVNAAHEWDYYASQLISDIGILNFTNGEVITKLQHGKSTTFRKITKNNVSINSDVIKFVDILETNYSVFDDIVYLNDSNRMIKDIKKEIFNFFPKELLDEINDKDTDSISSQAILSLASLPKKIDYYSQNSNKGDAYLFEKALTEGFNMFYDVDAELIGGAGNTDIECMYITKNIKFAVDAKSTKNKLTNLNAGRLRSHRMKIGAQYTVIVTSRYVPAVLEDIRDSEIVIIKANTFAELLYNCINYNVRDLSYEMINELIEKHLGEDISEVISDSTFKMFSIKRGG